MPRAKSFDEEEILEKAMMVFWNKGYHDTSIEDLVQELGLKRGSIYHTYGGKKELFYKALELYRLKGLELFGLFFQDSVKVKDGLRVLFVHTINSTISDPNKAGCFVANTTLEMIPGDPYIQELITRHQNGIETLFYDRLLIGKKNGEISGNMDLKIFSSLLYTMISGIRVVGKVHTDPKVLLKGFDTLLSMLD